MLIEDDQIIYKHKHVHRKKKMQSKLDHFFAVFIQPHVVYCNVCKAVDGARFVRNLIPQRGLAYRD